MMYHKGFAHLSRITQEEKTMNRVHYIVRADSHKGWFNTHDTLESAVARSEKYINEGYRKVIIYKAVATVIPKPRLEVIYHDD